MSNVYAVRNDGFKFQEFCLPITDLIDAAPESVSTRDVMKFHSKNLPMSSWWKPLQVQFRAAEGFPNASIPDICLWRGFTLVLSSIAHKILSSKLEPFGEFLPVHYGSQEYYIFNCLTLGLADEINSQQDIQDGVFMGVKKLAFNEIDIAEKLIFKTEYNRCASLFCLLPLKTLIEKEQFKGIVFNDDLVSEF